MEWVIGISSVVTAVATGVIAYATCVNNKMIKEMQKESEKEQEKFNDLLQALVIVTMCCNSGPTNSVLNHFNQFYTGKTPIFENKK